MRRLIRARMIHLGMTRKELSRVTGLSMTVIHGALGGFASPGNGARRLIEIAIGSPFWSTPEEFNSLTKYLSRSPQQFPQTTQTENHDK